MANERPKLMLSEEDYKRLSSLISACQLETAASLEEEVGRAEVMPADKLPSDVVAMDSTVTVADLDSGTEMEVTLVYPHEADMANQKVSVLAPMGVALIGLRCGNEYEWHMPNGKSRRFLVKEIKSKKDEAIGA